MYQKLAEELYQIFSQPENRSGVTTNLIDQVLKNPEKYPALNKTYNFSNRKEKGFFHMLLKIAGIRLYRFQTTHGGYIYRYTVPPSYWFMVPGRDQAVIMATCLPHNQPAYRDELVDIIQTLFPGRKFIDRRTIRENIDPSRWPNISQIVLSRMNDSVIATELKYMGCSLWSRPKRNAVFILPNNFWSASGGETCV